MKPILGCIADDLTGATDLASALVRQGMRVIQTVGIPARSLALPEVDALVTALKCRTIAPKEAVAQCLASLESLQQRGCTRFFWKYCSTFDSTPRGNIGPVAKALLDKLGGSALVCPAFPENGRTVYQGRLFVGGLPLDESPMRDHPLTPMRDASLQRLLEAQTGEAAGLVPWEVVRRGASAVRAQMEAEGQAGRRFVIADALEEADLFTLAEACADMPLITGGSGIALGLPQAYRQCGLLDARKNSECAMQTTGPVALLAGSCSTATRDQLQRWLARGLPQLRVEAARLAPDNGGAAYMQELENWAREHAYQTPMLHASAAPAEVMDVQRALGREAAGALVENALARLAVTLRGAGVRHFVVAGGETSGAVVTALGATALRIGPQIAPGVPWTLSVGSEPLALALKSGNFGGPDFFADALDMIEYSYAGAVA